MHSDDQGHITTKAQLLNDFGETRAWFLIIPDLQEQINSTHYCVIISPQTHLMFNLLKWAQIESLAVLEPLGVLA